MQNIDTGRNIYTRAIQKTVIGWPLFAQLAYSAGQEQSIRSLIRRAPFRQILTIRSYISVFIHVNKLKALELVRFDSKLASVALSLSYLIVVEIQKLFGREFFSLLVAARMFRHSQREWSRRYASNFLRNAIHKNGFESVADFFSKACCVDLSKVAKLRKTVIDATAPFNRRLIILSPPVDGKRGVLILKFTENFIYLSRLFDLDKLFRDYIMVLEPSFSGYFNPAILYLMGKKSPVIIQASEHIDYKFIEGLNSNLVPIDLGANCWVDNSTFHPIPNMKKHYDIIMVSLWADFKRHYHLFQALSKCRNKNKIKVALVGVPWQLSLQQIRQMARYYGVDGCIEYFENISQQQINILLNQSKVYLLLSKKEGFNKGIIEALFSGTPGFLLEGFNYGQRYDYINEQTGGFIHPTKLTEFIENIDSILREGDFSPSSWVKKYMSVDNSMAKLDLLLREIETKYKLEINRQMQSKINTPDCDYQDTSNWNKFSDYYKKLNNYLI